MTKQMLVRIDPALKDKLDRIARAEGKSASGMIRELIAAFVKERDIGATIDDLWARIGGKLKAKGIRSSDVDKAIKNIRRKRS